MDNGQNGSPLKEEEKENYSVFDVANQIGDKAANDKESESHLDILIEYFHGHDCSADFLGLWLNENSLNNKDTDFPHCLLELHAAAICISKVVRTGSVSETTAVLLSSSRSPFGYGLMVIVQYLSRSGSNRGYRKLQGSFFLRFYLLLSVSHYRGGGFG